MKRIYYATSICVFLFLTSITAFANSMQDIVIVLDNSGSMKKNDPQFLAPRAVINMLQNFSSDSRVSIMIFDQGINMALPLTPLSAESREAILSGLKQVNYNGRYTNSPAALERSIYELKNKGRKDASRFIIFMTDGIVDTGNKANDTEKTRWLREDLAADAASTGIRIFGIAFTDEADFQLIQTLSQKTGGEYFRALTAQDLDGVFKKISENLDAARPTSPKEPVTSAQTEKSLPWMIILFSVFGVAVIIAVAVLLKRKSPEPTTPPMAPSPPTTKIPRTILKDLSQITGKESHDITFPLTMIVRSISQPEEGINYITIDQKTISRHHATIEYKNRMFYISDHGSMNGTFLNSQKATNEVRLKHRDRVRFDKFEFEFFIPAAEGSGATVIATQLSDDSDAPAAIIPEKTQVTEVDDEGDTYIDQGQCPHHPAWHATVQCRKCKKYFCPQCVTGGDDPSGEICFDCLHIT